MRLPAAARARAKAYLQSVAGQMSVAAPEGSSASRSTYLAIAELHRRSTDQRPGALRDLASYELKVFSQNGEDGVLGEILRRVGVQSRTFVEFGAGSGAEGTCVYLADVRGWSGWFIEADDRAFDTLASKYAMSTAVVAQHGLVTPDNVEPLFDQLAVPEAFDVLSIDIDSRDYWVWRAIRRYRPRVVVIEYNAHLGSQPLTMPLTAQQPWDGTDYFGASLGALRPLGKDKGYELVHCDLAGINAFFVRSDLLGDHFLAASEVVLRAPNYRLKGDRHPSGTGSWEVIGT